MSSEEQSVSIFVALAKPYYMAGDKVEGNVMVHFKSNVNTTGVYLKISGAEKAQASLESHNLLGRIGYFKHNTIIFPMSGCFPAGQFVFPFSFQLPDAIPASTKFRSGQFNASIAYKVQGTVCLKDKEDVHHVVEVVVVPPPPPSDVLISMDSSALNVCCGKRGAVEVELRVEGNGLIHPSNPEVSFAYFIANSSSVVAQLMRVEVIQRVAIRSEVSLEATTTERTEIVAFANLPKVKAKGSIPETTCTIKIPLSGFSSPSSRGMVVDVQHFLRISRAGAPIVQVPIVLHADVITKEEMDSVISSKIPSDWTPVHAQEIHVSPPILTSCPSPVYGPEVIFSSDALSFLHKRDVTVPQVTTPPTTNTRQASNEEPEVELAA